MRYPLRALAGALLLALPAVPSCSPDTTGPPPDDGAVVRLDRDSLTVGLLLGGRLVADRVDSTGQPAPAPLRWVSRNTAVAVVDSQGFVTGMGIGRTWIVVSDTRHVDSARVSTYTRYAFVSAGTDVTCGLSEVGRVLCWGWNEVGSVGTSVLGQSRSPMPVTGLPTFGELILGGGSVCGLAGTALSCWGYNGVGQLGDGTITNRFAPVRIADTLALSGVTIGAGVTACAFDAGGTPLCWGWNGWGQLADSGLPNSHRPHAMTLPFTPTAFATGGGHVCALDQAGAVWCWGRNDRGQLGDGSTASRATPAQVGGLPAIIQLTAGVAHTCARDAVGHVWCWGDNVVGQLGAGTIVDHSATPLPAGGGLTFDTVTTTSNHTCALAAGTAWCWGENADGQLGTGAAGGQQISAVQVSGGLQFQSISAGVHHTCGLADDGFAYCWGLNLYGALGDGSSQDASAPVRVGFQ